ncbi:MAG: DUF58 domain-containing protein [Candidatus Thermoplasmatota archaeon]|nr:DUF58 domain-containing protein [Candidatus Thermoplasmatota archaeon]
MKRSKMFVCVAILAIAGLIFGNLFGSWVFFVGALSSLSLFVMATFSSPSQEMQVDVSRESKEDVKELYVGDQLELSINIENKEDDTTFLEVHDILPSEVEVVEGSNHQLLRLKGEEKKKLDYTVSCPRSGNIDIGPIKVRSRSPLNFFSREIDSKEDMTLRVLPRTEDMKSVNIHPSYTKHWLGDIKSKSIGIGSEFFSIREYHPGDEIRDINWKATARHLTPLTNEYEGEKSGDVILVVDGYENGIVGTKKYNTLGASIDAAASLSSAILSARNRLGLIVSGEYINWVYPGTGKNHYHRIMSNLIGSESGGTWGLEGVKWLLEDFFPRKSLIIFISPLTVPEFSETIIDLCRKEYDVMVISPDPLKIEKRILDEYEETAERIYRMERENVKEKLWTYGTVVVDWDPDEPLEPALQEVLRYKEKI